MSSKANTFEELVTIASTLQDTGKDADTIRQALSASGADEQTQESIIHQIKTLHYLRRRKRGFMFGAAGSIILIVGFFLTVFLFHQGSSFNLIMYGMTSLGAILLLVGMVDILGW